MAQRLGTPAAARLSLATATAGAVMGVAVLAPQSGPYVPECVTPPSADLFETPSDGGPPPAEQVVCALHHLGIA